MTSRAEWQAASVTCARRAGRRHPGTISRRRAESREARHDVRLTRSSRARFLPGKAVGGGMGSPRIARSGLRSPRGWLFLAFLGVWLYLASQLLRLYPARVADVVVLPVSEVREILALSAGLGQLLFFGGLVAALWRANLAAGVSDAGIRGLAFGVAGVGLLGVFEFALFLDWLGAAFNPMALFARTPVLATGVIAGTAVAFAGPASLLVGLRQSTGLFGRRERVVSQRAAQGEGTGGAAERTGPGAE